MALSLADSLNRGISYLQSNELDKAEKLFQGVLLLQEGNIDALRLLGLVKLQQGLREDGHALLHQAVSHCRKVLLEDEENLQLNLLLAHLFIDLQDWQQAEQAFRQSLKINSDLSEAYNGLGSIYFLRGQIQKAYSLYYQALKKDNNNIEALYNQGLVLRSLGKLGEAKKYLSQAIKVVPQHISARASLGLTFQELGEFEDAKTAYEKVLELEPSNTFAQHMLAALTGETTEKAPANFIADLFDVYAPAYEQHLQETLCSQASDEVIKVLDESAQNYFPFDTVLDLGCGTGLMAVKLQHRATEIDGVDLSEKMLMLANNKGLYRSLMLNDIESYLQSNTQQYDCCIASDVFIYSGALHDIFSRVFEALKDNGFFVFTTEGCETGFSLLKSGRYAHSISYIENIASRCQFTISYQSPIKLRKEESHWLDGNVYLLTKRLV